VRVRGAADGLAARRRVEAALAGVAPSNLGLPPRAVLMVRRVAPKARLRLHAAARADGFARAVHADLELRLRQARRPWLDHGAGTADAVLFADESEMMACLVRDWLRGVIAERWWWPAVLGGMPAPLWWRGSLLSRGDVLPAVLAQLAPQGEAVALMATLSDDEVVRATTAVIDAHALPSVLNESAPLRRLVAISPRAVGPLVAERSAAEQPVPAKAPVEEPQARALAASRRRLLALMPELQTPWLTAAQRHLLAVALGLQRASAWTRSAAFAAALRSLDTATVCEDAAAVTSAGAVLRCEPDGRAGDSMPHAAQARSAKQLVPTGATVPAAAPGAGLPTSADSAAEPVAAGPAPPPLPVRLPSVAPPVRADTPAPPMFARQDAAALPAKPVRAGSQSIAAQEPIAARPNIETQFGGVFYLLNVALALGLYGDFTQPRVPGIALSPWDWLALVGRMWFGREFENDPVWTLLAELAGRLPPQPPGRDFAPPETWSVPAAWLAPWGPVVDLEVCPTRERLQIWHSAGFVAIDVRRERGRRPLRQAHILCARHDALRDARLTRMGKRLSRRATDLPCGRSLARWMGWILPYLDARLKRALGTEDASSVAAQVCRHPARLRCTATHLDVHLSLAKLPLALRIAGLDRDPGWIPAAGRTVAFHFE